MAKKITLTIFEDPGHGWCRFPRTRLQKIGIDKQISSFSYQRGDYVYLEEDGDLGLLYETLKNLGYEITLKNQHTNKSSKIRSYDHYRP